MQYILYQKWGGKVSKIDFCNLLFEYIKDGFTTLDIITKDDVYVYYDFEKDSLFLSEKYFAIKCEGLFRIEINYEDVRGIVY